MMNRVFVVDYGSQYTQLIARRVRELGYYSVVVAPDEPVDPREVSALVLSGGPHSVFEKNAPQLPPWWEDYKGRVLGICYGMQLICHELGGIVKRGALGEYGKTEVTVSSGDPLFLGIPSTFTVWMSHGDEVAALPDGFRVLARTKAGVIAAATDSRRFWLVQFHPEVRHTTYGVEILRNFLTRVCALSPDWNLEDFLQSKVKELKRELEGKKVIAAFSGGVDSSTAAMLVHKAIGSDLVSVFVDHGFLRKGEEEEVTGVFRDLLGMNLVVVDARRRFLERLRGVTDPEKKRRIIGEEFIRVFEDEAKKHKAEYLVQGTIYSDVIESSASGRHTDRIKSHHNVGGLPERMNLKLVEPIRELFKDEVRRLGEIMGIPHHIIWRHPFPGPGLAVRIIGEITEERLRVLKEVDHIFLEVLRESGWYEKTWQAFAVLLPVRSVGVRGDRRSYGYVVALRAVDSVEAMTADWTRLPAEILDEATRRILNRVKEVTRVVFDVTSKPPGTIEWE